MVKIEHVETAGWRAAIRGMRNPLESWDQSDSTFSPELNIGQNDLKLMKKLANAGADHGKYLRMIVVYCDIVAPLYWLKEMDTYRMGVEKNSCSTMHKIHAHEFTRDDFSMEHNLYYGNLDHTIDALNHARSMYLETKQRKWWYSMIQTLPSSFNQRRTYMFSYQALRNMYHARNVHKLDEWREFCWWMHKLPYHELITRRD